MICSLRPDSLLIWSTLLSSPQLHGLSLYSAETVPKMVSPLGCLILMQVHWLYKIKKLFQVHQFNNGPSSWGMKATSWQVVPWIPILNDGLTDSWMRGTIQRRIYCLQQQMWSNWDEVNFVWAEGISKCSVFNTYALDHWQTGSPTYFHFKCCSVLLNWP